MRERTAPRVSSRSAGTKTGTRKVIVTDGVRAQHFDNITAEQEADLVANPRFAWGKATLHGDTAQQSMDKLDALLDLPSKPTKVVVKRATTRKPRKAA